VDLRSVTWGRVALDEAQKIKNPTAASSVAVRSINAPRKLALTGTPVENHLGELWSIMDLLNPGLLGSQAEFREKFAVPIEKGGDRGRARRLREMIRPFVLRRTKDDPDIVGDLPAKMEMNVYCGLTAEQAAMYERVTGEMLGRIDTATGIRRRGLILSVLTKLKQVCDHPALVADDVPRVLNRSGKAQRLAEMLEEVIEEGEKALVFTQYRQMGDMLVEMLEKRLGRRILFLHGGTPQPKRDELVMEFQSGGVLDTPPVFILSLRAGGLGLNLTAASHVFHFDRWWNPAVENQATDRAHRIGQRRRVQVHKYVSIGTVEERIDRMLQEKSQLASNIVGSGDDWLTELSTSELKDYLSLSREAVAGEGEEDEDE
jgi:SNF2 family DNA or RNA helicase